MHQELTNDFQEINNFIKNCDPSNIDDLTKIFLLILVFFHTFGFIHSFSNKILIERKK